MDPYILRSYLAPLRADLALQEKRVRQLRAEAAKLVRSGRDDRMAIARLQDAEETQAFYAAELVRLERELAAIGQA